MALRSISMIVFGGLSVIGTIAPSLAADTFYVSSGQTYSNITTVPAAGINDLTTNIKGSGKNRGSIQYPFLTIQYAAKQAHAGDAVIVRDGLYNENVYLGLSSGKDVVTSQSGTEKAPIAFVAEHSGKASVRGSATYDGCFHIKGADQTDVGWTNITNPIGYIEIRGFDLQSTGYDGKGVFLTWAHHITVRDCNIHDNGGAGIGTMYSDYQILEGNTVIDNCRTSSFNGSGISIFKIRLWDKATSGYHAMISRNTCFNNYISPGKFKILPDKDGMSHLIHHTDGNGIIVDTSYQNISALVANNLVYHNGGRGIIIDGTSNVDILNNTCYQNNIDPEVGGTQEINLQQVVWESPKGPSNPENSICQFIKIQDNICWPSDGKHCVGIENTTENVTVVNNWFYSGNNSSLIGYDTLRNKIYPTPPNRSGWNLEKNYGKSEPGVNLPGGDPLFVNPRTNASTNFRLQAVSPCRDKAITHLTNDIDNHIRPVGSGYDLGAFEYHP